MPPKINTKAQSKNPTVSHEKKKTLKDQITNTKAQQKQNTNPSKEEKGKAKAIVQQEQIIAPPKNPSKEEKGKGKAKIQPDLHKPTTNTNDTKITLCAFIPPVEFR